MTDNSIDNATEARKLDHVGRMAIGQTGEIPFSKISGNSFGLEGSRDMGCRKRTG